MQSQCFHHVNICFFILFSFAKMTHAFNYLSVFSEVFLFHEITWTNIKKFWYLVNVISWSKKVLSHRWAWNNMSWVCFHCEIKWIKKSSSNISLSYFMLTHNGNQPLLKKSFMENFIFWLVKTEVKLNEKQGVITSNRWFFYFDF